MAITKSWMSTAMCLMAMLLRFYVARGKVSNSACYGDISTNATKMYLTCGNDVINILNITAGVKAIATDCPSFYNDPSTQDIGCCSPSNNVGDDCEFKHQNETNLRTLCDGKMSCEPEVENVASNGQCPGGFPPVSLYMFITYECVADPTLDTSSDDANGSNTALIIGPSVAGGVVVLVAAVVGGVLLWFFKIRKSEKVSPHEPAVEINPNESNDSKTLQDKLKTIDLV